MHQGPVVVAGTGRQPLHQGVPAGGVINRGAHQAVLEDRRGDRFQVVKGQLGEGVLGGEHLALFGDFDAPPHGAAWLGEDRLVGRTAAASYRATAAVEDTQGHAVLGGELLQGDLGPVNLPVAGEEAGILVAVRVSEHHLLKRFALLTAGDQELAVEGIGEQAPHHGRGALQILHGLEQGNDQQVGAPGEGIHQARLLGQEEYFEQVGHRVTHRDHVGAADA